MKKTMRFLLALPLIAALLLTTAAIGAFAEPEAYIEKHFRRAREYNEALYSGRRIQDPSRRMLRYPPYTIWKPYTQAASWPR